MNLSVSPARSAFAVLVEKTPAQAGKILADYCVNFARLPNSQTKTLDLYHILYNEMGIRTKCHLGMATELIAREIDCGAFIHDYAYHNRQHTHEIMIGLAYLVLKQEALRGRKFESEDKAKMMLAVMAHDVGHDGEENGDQAFRLEHLAFDKIKPCLDKAQVSHKSQKFIHGLLLVTDLHARPRLLDNVRRILDSSENISLPGDQLHPDFPPALWYLTDDLHSRKFALMAGLVSDADLMPLTSWSMENHSRGMDRLSQESNGALQPGISHDSVVLLDLINRRLTTEAGRFLQPNLDLLYREAAFQASTLPAGLAPASKTVDAAAFHV